ncbi:hypothetical protein GALL_209350 [mine drainage metagenome]|uniref:Uncharacterized protein n=1 Tax=mine drainage metagenome TaxID=410659 RepID=A0A1J5RM60_9ZZZZ
MGSNPSSLLLPLVPMILARRSPLRSLRCLLFNSQTELGVKDTRIDLD